MTDLNPTPIAPKRSMKMGQDCSNVLDASTGLTSSSNQYLATTRPVEYYEPFVTLQEDPETLDDSLLEPFPVGTGAANPADSSLLDLLFNQSNINEDDYCSDSVGLVNVSPDLAVHLAANSLIQNGTTHARKQDGNGNHSPSSSRNAAGSTNSAEMMGLECGKSFRDGSSTNPAEYGHHENKQNARKMKGVLKRKREVDDAGTPSLRASTWIGSNIATFRPLQPPPYVLRRPRKSKIPRGGVFLSQSRNQPAAGTYWPIATAKQPPRPSFKRASRT